MTVEIRVYLSADTLAKEYFTYLDDELGLKEYDALASAFRALVSLQTENKFHKLTMVRVKVLVNFGPRGPLLVRGLPQATSFAIRPFRLARVRGTDRERMLESKKGLLV